MLKAITHLKYAYIYTSSNSHVALRVNNFCVAVLTLKYYSIICNVAIYDYGNSNVHMCTSILIKFTSI